MTSQSGSLSVQGLLLSTTSVDSITLQLHTSSGAKIVLIHFAKICCDLFSTTKKSIRFQFGCVKNKNLAGSLNAAIMVFVVDCFFETWHYILNAARLVRVRIFQNLPPPGVSLLFKKKVPRNNGYANSLS